MSKAAEQEEIIDMMFPSCSDKLCGSKKQTILWLERYPTNVELRMRCEECGTISLIDIPTAEIKQVETEPLEKKKEVTYLG